MRLDSKLNLIIPVERDGGEIYVHSMPLSREVFERHFMIISKAFSALYAEGLNAISGPRVAALILKQLSISAGTWEGPDGVENSLLNEIRRLTNVVLPSDRGWTNIPLEVAVARKLLDGEELAEVENAICFFIFNSAMHKKNILPSILAGMESLWGTQTTSLNVTAFAASLPISTETDNSGETATPYLAPS